MARRRIVLDNFLGGLHTHDFKPGTLRLAQDVLPYKGMLRKRGPKTLEARSGTSTLDCFGYSETVNEEYAICVRSSSSARVVELDAASAPATVTLHSANTPSFWHPDGFAGQSHPWIQIGDELVLASGADKFPGQGTKYPNSRGQHLRWAGNTDLSAAHTTGNVTTTVGSRVINGGSVSPAFTSSHVNAFIELGNTDLGCYRIVKVVSATQIVVDVPVATALTNASYEINAVGRACVNNLTTAGTRLFSNYVDTGGTLRPAYSPQTKNFLFARMLVPHQQRVFAFGLSEPVPLDATSTNYSQAMDSVVRWSGTQKDAQTNGVPWWCNFNVNAYAEIHGTGTAIGAASFQGSLVCLKDRSISLLSGPVASDGTDLGVSQSLISDHVGAARPGSWGVGRTGVFFCNHEGLFEWNGQELRNHVEGRIGSFWDNWLNSDNGSVPVLSVVGDRVYVVPRSGTYAFDVALFWSIPYQAWFFQQTGSADGFAAPIHRVMRGGAPWRDVMIHYDGLVDHSGDYDFGSAGSELGGASGPTVSVATQPIQISPDGISGGRPTNVFLKYRLEDGGSDNPELDPSLYLSPLGVDDSDSSYGIVYGDGLTETDHGLETRRMQVGGSSTIPLDGASGADSGFVSVRLDQQNDAKDVVLAAVGVEFEDEGRWPQN